MNRKELSLLPLEEADDVWLLLATHSDMNATRGQAACAIDTHFIHLAEERAKADLVLLGCTADSSSSPSKAIVGSKERTGSGWALRPFVAIVSVVVRRGLTCLLAIQRREGVLGRH